MAREFMHAIYILDHMGNKQLKWDANKINHTYNKWFDEADPIDKFVIFQK